MTDEKIDRILANEDELIPSSGFVSSVMARIHEEIAAPAPIPFPWKRAVPGILLACLGLGWGIVGISRQALAAVQITQAVSVTIPDTVMRPAEALLWTALALGISFGTWRMARRAGGDSALL
jgi:hypothetical protein